MFLMLLMFLDLPCSSCPVVRLLTLVDFDSVSVLDRHTGALLGAGPRHRDSQGLSKHDWPHLPSAATAASLSPSVALSTSSFQQWHHRLGHLCGSRLSFLVRRGLLGSVSGGVSLDCQGCRLGKQVQLPYPHSDMTLYLIVLSTLFTLMSGVQLHLPRNGVIATILSL